MRKNRKGTRRRRKRKGSRKVFGDFERVGRGKGNGKVRKAFNTRRRKEKKPINKRRNC